MHQLKSDSHLPKIFVLFFMSIFQEKCFSFYSLLIDQISLSDCLYFLRYWAVTSQNLKLTLSFSSSRFDTRPKSQGKSLNILRKKRDFNLKQKAFFIIFKRLSVAKNCLRPDTAILTLIWVGVLGIRQDFQDYILSKTH